MAVYSKASARTMTQWIVDLEQQGALSSSEASWLLQDVTRGPAGIMHHLFVASHSSFDQFQLLMLEGCALLVVQGLMQASVDTIAGAAGTTGQKQTRTLPRTSSVSAGSVTSPTRSLQRPAGQDAEGGGGGGLRLPLDPPSPSRRPSRCLPATQQLPQVQDVSDSELPTDVGQESRPELSGRPQEGSL
ncbi:hypothetical protein BCR44DRAFT_1430956 [Catenaria anguillulae PL171]|uniref:Uncharacterized protein n=1 Tax=Catenaria anguillulae PL171 TaxID=765915 RepID=A0A1Y2HU87_9FUNG|nr:hypothetical protein BCR44DRAFT_1430956 [Catenaria anguillulae PL171]